MVMFRKAREVMGNVLKRRNKRKEIDFRSKRERESRGESKGGEGSSKEEGKRDIENLWCL